MTRCEWACTLVRYPLRIRTHDVYCGDLKHPRQRVQILTLERDGRETTHAIPRGGHIEISAAGVTRSDGAENFYEAMRFMRGTP